jgi:hypothetical protein
MVGVLVFAVEINGLKEEFKLIPICHLPSARKVIWGKLVLFSGSLMSHFVEEDGWRRWSLRLYPNFSV